MTGSRERVFVVHVTNFMLIRGRANRPLKSWDLVWKLQSLLIAVPLEVQINAHKIVKGFLYWTATQQQLPITTVHTLTYAQ